MGYFDIKISEVLNTRQTEELIELGVNVLNWP